MPDANFGHREALLSRPGEHLRVDEKRVGNRQEFSQGFSSKYLESAITIANAGSE
jgi:hypothetical protein